MTATPLSVITASCAADRSRDNHARQLGVLVSRNIVRGFGPSSSSYERDLALAVIADDLESSQLLREYFALVDARRAS